MIYFGVEIEQKALGMNSFHHFGEKILKLEEILSATHQPCPHSLLYSDVKRPFTTIFQSQFSSLLQRPQSSYATIMTSTLVGAVSIPGKSFLLSLLIFKNLD